MPLSRTSVINCGSGGQICLACAVGQLCTGGACLAPVGMEKVGDACTTDAQCQLGLGVNALCKRTTTTGNATYSGGYCTLRCGTASNVCPSGSSCVGLLPAYGEGDTICWDNCSATDRCRVPGYACYTLSGGSACWISPLPTLDAGPPADKIGNPCLSDSACTNPPTSGGACLTREFNYAWTGGYCTRTNCSGNDECSVDGGALCLGITALDNVCVQRCADARDGGQSTCRNGYLCQQYFSGAPDGGQQPSVDGFCAPPLAPVPTSIGQPCAADVDCQVPAGAIADCQPATLLDGGASGFPGGECTRFGCASDDDCSLDGGARCFGIGGNSTACLPMCAAAGAGQSNCRTGYLCGAYGLADSGLSLDGVCDPACNVPGGGCGVGTTCSASGYCQ